MEQHLEGKIPQLFVDKLGLCITFQVTEVPVRTPLEHYNQVGTRTIGPSEEKLLERFLQELVRDGHHWKNSHNGDLIGVVAGA